MSLKPMKPEYALPKAPSWPIHNDSTVFWPLNTFLHNKKWWLIPILIMVLLLGLLVVAASLFGLPVSTTHVSVGSLFGIGVMTRQVDHRVLRNIVLSWVVTLPCAAVLGASAYWLAGR